MIFNLPDYHVIDAVDLPSGGRRVIVQAGTVADGCPECGVVSERVHGWCRQRVRDVPHAGRVEVIVRKPRLVCTERACPRRTFTQTTAESPLRARSTTRLRRAMLQTTAELPLRARSTTRLRRAMLEAVIDHGRPVAGVARTRGVAWWTTQTVVNAAALVLPDVDDLHVKHLGIDEHRYRRVRWFRDPDTSGWARVEPWMTTLVNVASGQVLGVVDGRDSTAVEGWLNARSQSPFPDVAGPDPDRGDRPVRGVPESDHHQPAPSADRC